MVVAQHPELTLEAANVAEQLRLELKVNLPKQRAVAEQVDGLIGLESLTEELVQVVGRVVHFLL